MADRNELGREFSTPEPKYTHVYRGADSLCILICRDQRPPTVEITRDARPDDGAMDEEVVRDGVVPVAVGELEAIKREHESVKADFNLLFNEYQLLQMDNDRLTDQLRALERMED